MAVYKYWKMMYCNAVFADIFTWYLTFQQYFILIPLIGYVFHVIGKLRSTGNVNR
jgi:hypothetical protein